MLTGAARFGRCPMVPGLLFGVVIWCVYAICRAKGLHHTSPQAARLLKVGNVALPSPDIKENVGE